MASKRRVRRSQCAGKVRFATHGAAYSRMQIVIKAGNKRGGWLHVYFCTFCKGYHYGHAAGSSKGAF